MNDDLRDAAFRAGVWQTIEQRAKELKDQAKQELLALEPGDAVAGRWEGQAIAKATMTRGKSRLVVTDEQKLIEWLQYHHPDEIVFSANTAYLKSLETRAKQVGAVIDSEGEVVPGVELQDGTPYVSVRREKEAPFIVAQLMASGRLGLDGIRELES